MRSRIVRADKKSVYPVDPDRNRTGPQRSPEQLARMRAAKAAKQQERALGITDKPTIVDFVTRDLG